MQLNPSGIHRIIAFLLLLIATNGYSQTPEQKLAQLGIQLSNIPAPIASYVHVVKTGTLLFLAGKGPQQINGEYIKGKVGSTLTIGQGYEAARLTGTIQLGLIKEAVGDLSKVKRIVKVTGVVNSDAGFSDHPKVINGFSDLMMPYSANGVNMPVPHWVWRVCP